MRGRTRSVRFFVQSTFYETDHFELLKEGGRRRMRSRAVSVLARVIVPILTIILLPTSAYAQSPWERAANNLATTFTGPLARSLALVAIVIGGLLFMFGEAGAKRQISGIVFGGGLALFAAQFLTWLF